MSDSAGTVIGVNKYDEYGKPAPANIGRFQYTGQAWLPELQLYYYKHRMYHPALGRFLQPDPIGYEGGPNLYNYVGSDPVNSTDPSGMKTYKPPENQGGGGHAGGVNWSTGSLFGNCPAGSRCLSNGVDMDVLKMAIDIAMHDFFNHVVDQCARRTRCGGANNQENVDRSETLRALLNDRDVRAQMERSWDMSFGHPGRQEVHEHGFWIGQLGSNFYAHGIQEARLDRAWGIIAGPSWGASIFFHTHPFIISWSGLSQSDLSTARIRDILIIAYSHNEFYTYDQRKTGEK